MNIYLFKNLDYGNDPNWIVKEFYNSINLRGRFIWALPFITGKIGCGVEESFCNFPDKSSEDPEENFEGINFGIYGAEVIVSEKIGFGITKDACNRFIELYPKEKLTVMQFIKDIEEMGY